MNFHQTYGNKKGTPKGPFQIDDVGRLLRYNNVLCVCEVGVNHRNCVVTCSQVVLHNNAVTTDNVFLSNFLRNHSLSRHVSDFEDDVLTTQVQLTIKLHAECALEYWVREDVPLSRVIDVRQAVAIAVVLAEARTVVVRGVSVVVSSVCVCATEYLSVS